MPTRRPRNNSTPPPEKIRPRKPESTLQELSPKPIQEGLAKPSAEKSANGRTRARASEKDDKANSNQPTRIVRLLTIEGVKLFHTANLEAFATINNKDHLENWKVKERNFGRWVAGEYYKREGTVASEKNVAAAIHILECQAIFDYPEQVLHVRVAGDDECIYIDLANRKWEAVKVTPSGWQVLSDPPVKFRRSPGMAPLPTPVHGGSLSELRPFLNVRDEEHFLLILAWMVAALRPTGPYPPLVVEGIQGSAKSTAGRLIRSLVDPNTTPLRSTPKSERDLMITASNSWCVAFENVSELPPWLSDCLCRLSTGGGFSTRLNYSDDEEKLFDAMRPVVLNGITVGLERADLVDRGLVILLDEIRGEKRLPEMLFWAEVEKAKPRIFGALLDAISCALRRLPDIKIANLPRMADFACWAIAAEPALGFEEGAFLSAYSKNRQDANELALESSQIVPAVKALLEWGTDWSGSATELLQALREQAKVSCNQQGWPKTAGKLSEELRRLTPNLRGIGICVQFEQTPGPKSKKIITLKQGA